MAQKNLAVWTNEEYNYKEFKNLLKRKHAGTEGRAAPLFRQIVFRQEEVLHETEKEMAVFGDGGCAGCWDSF